MSRLYSRPTRVPYKLSVLWITKIFGDRESRQNWAQFQLHWRTRRFFSSEDLTLIYQTKRSLSSWKKFLTSQKQDMTAKASRSQENTTFHKVLPSSMSKHLSMQSLRKLMRNNSKEINKSLRYRSSCPNRKELRLRLRRKNRSLWTLFIFKASRQMSLETLLFRKYRVFSQTDRSRPQSLLKSPHTHRSRAQMTASQPLLARQPLLSYRANKMLSLPFLTLERAFPSNNSSSHCSLSRTHSFSSLSTRF